MALHAHSAIKPDYPFLAHPPPQKKRPSQPLPSPPPLSSGPDRDPRRRSSTFSAIAAWAAHVQPGSPSPCSPHRRPSLRKSRRPSVVSICTPSRSFLHIAPTPRTAYAATPSVCDFKADLTTVGYTSVFLQLPNTPISATLSVSIKPSSPNAAKNIPIPSVLSPTCRPRGFTRLRSLSVLRSRHRSKSGGPDSPTKMKAKAAVASAAIVKRKKAKYATCPPPLANELALMQFADGGSMDNNIKRIVEAQDKAIGAVGLADVYRDGDGGIWRDQDEEWEYAHLLAESDESRPHITGGLQWVTFGSTSPSIVGVPKEERRGSVSTQGSDLDPKYVIQPADPFGGDDLFGSAVAFSWPHTSPRIPKFPNSSGMGARIVIPKGKARRRPAPLQLSPSSLACKRPTNSPIDTDKVRKDFIEASFEPVSLLPVTPAIPATAVDVTKPVGVRARLVGSSRAINVPRQTVNDGLTSLGMKTKPSMLNMKGLFRLAKKDDVMC